MDCPACGTTAVAIPIPPKLRGYLPGDPPGTALCTQCLAMQPIDDPPPEPPDLQRISDAFPGDPAASIPMALVIGLLDSLALYRSEIADLLERVERAGSDPLLVLDRLAADDSIDTALDLRGRRRQLEQLV